LKKKKGKIERKKDRKGRIMVVKKPEFWEKKYF
jgi:hypothetical protein